MLSRVRDVSVFRLGRIPVGRRSKIQIDDVERNQTQVACARNGAMCKVRACFALDRGQQVTL